MSTTFSIFHSFPAVKAPDPFRCLRIKHNDIRKPLLPPGRRGFVHGFMSFRSGDQKLEPPQLEPQLEPQLDPQLEPQLDPPDPLLLVTDLSPILTLLITYT